MAHSDKSADFLVFSNPSSAPFNGHQLGQKRQQKSVLDIERHLLANLCTLEYKINVPVRLLISQIFSHQYAFISDGTFIEIGIFRNLILWTFGKNFKKYSKIFKELLEFILWNVMIGIGLYIECNCKVFLLKFC